MSEKDKQYEEYKKYLKSLNLPYKEYERLLKEWGRINKYEVGVMERTDYLLTFYFDLYFYVIRW